MLYGYYSLLNLYMILDFKYILLLLLRVRLTAGQDNSNKPSKTEERMTMKSSCLHLQMPPCRLTHAHTIYNPHIHFVIEVRKKTYYRKQVYIKPSPS